MPSTSISVPNWRWINCLVLSAALLPAGCVGKKAPPKDLVADIDEVAASLIEQPLLHSASIGVVYRGREFIRHRGDMSRRLPIGRFFSISSILIAVMAVILIGKGVAALQEAGWISQTPLALPRIEWIGLYPTWQSLLAQVLVGTAAIVGFLANARSGVRRQPGANKQ